ncbi:glycine--tRNA ligase subunit beta [Insolitispirillum peregrinum]|uniref:Glycine--tRNA ligase beta subunit n=1 Tax=Insolitispirillum peregrinum TaxID=80876 RepID=A0A1N7LBB1_9PROT|nr:glycine--tRNA ligase subunit beta [Insolitispirillum peregrinum]SIS71063.1 glycyl-tRNA synthetase beta chain [Insolitispirillum peregrinum]
MAEFLLELFSEEIPARMQATATETLHKLVADGLAKAGFPHLSARSYVTPRRLTLVIDDLPAATPDVSEERRGPKVDAPAKAVEGFLASVGLTLEQCEQRETPKGTFLFATLQTKGRPTAEVLKDVVEGALAVFPWPKSMRWSDNPTRWVRPLHSILCLFGGEIVPVAFARVTAGNSTRGHRFLAPDAFTVSDFADYQAKLRAAFVMLDANERREVILAQAEAAAKAEGYQLKDDIGLLNEVCGLVEWPTALVGKIDDAFMDVPGEVLSTSMRAHQKYFSLLKADGSLAPRFVVVSNMLTADNGAQIVAGNERVLRARLSDAKFFWDQDRKARLDSRIAKLGERVFHARLGSDLDKVTRVTALAKSLAAHIPGADLAQVERAAQLAKADLSTGMVGEFPELQGVMGRYYALHDGEQPVVADAVAEHYSPLGPNDSCPTKPVSVAVALADKIDTLVGFWGIGEKPTGSKDPFALRRAALGVIRLVLENKLRLPLLAAFAQALSGYAGVATVADSDTAALPADLLAFFADRLKVFLREQGVRHDLIAAVFGLGNEDDLVRLLKRVDALGGLVNSDDGANLLAAYRRAMNIVRIEDKKDGPHDGPVDPAALVQAEEQALFAALQQVEAAAAPALAAEDYAGAVAALAGLRAPLDAFFDQVTVNAADHRANRLRLLARIGQAMGQVADFSAVEG